MLLGALYSLRSERALVERLDTDLLFRWFCGIDPAQPIFDATAFTRNRPRMDKHGLTAVFFDAVARIALDKGLCSDEHFSVDGTLIESYASTKSFVPTPGITPGTTPEKDDGSPENSEGTSGGGGFKPRNPWVDFHGKKRSNKTHRSTTDPQAKLYRKGNGQAARLCHMGHTVVENRNGLILGVGASEANGTAECVQAIKLIDQMNQPVKG